jgi:putative transposase
MKCKYCGSSDTIKFGTHTDTEGNEIQRYYCKDCRRKFVPDTLLKMQTPMNQVSSALSMYYGGMSLDNIQRHIKQEYNNDVAESTIYYWVTKFTKEAIDRYKNFMPDVGDVWIADETGIDIHGSKRDLWFWDIIDSKSRYLLASHISENRTTEDARKLIEKAVQRAGKYPRVIITDRLKVYIDGIDLSVGLDRVQHIRSKPFTTVNSTNKIERFHGTFKDRTKVVRAFKSMDTARLLTDGWLIHYNFFKEHEALGNVPPAQKMGIITPFKDWTDIVKPAQPKPTIQRVETAPFFRPLTAEQIQRQTKREYLKQATRKHRAKRKLQKRQQKKLMPRIRGIR